MAWSPIRRPQTRRRPVRRRVRSAGAMAYSSNGSDQFYGGPTHPSDPGYYPQRPNSYFGGSAGGAGTLSSPGGARSDSREHYRDSHEMSHSQHHGGNAPRRSSMAPSSSAASRARQRTTSNQHAFGDDGSDSDESDNGGQGFNIYNGPSFVAPGDAWELAEAAVVWLQTSTTKVPGTPRQSAVPTCTATTLSPRHRPP